MVICWCSSFGMNNSTVAHAHLLGCYTIFPRIFPWSWTQQAQYVVSLCGASVADGGPTLAQYRADLLYPLGYLRHHSYPISMRNDICAWLPCRPLRGRGWMYLLYPKKHGCDWEWSRPHGPKNLHSLLMNVRPLSWACGHVSEMLLILRKYFWPDYAPIFPKKCPTILYAVNLIGAMRLVALATFS